MVYLIPSLLSENATETIPAYVVSAVKDCQVIFAENERTVRRFLKKIDRQIVIDDFEWHSIHKAEAEQLHQFRNAVNQGKNIAIISEAGCPGIADPGQILVAEAQRFGVTVKPLIGPSSILLGLMASGLGGQKFSFHGYLPIDDQQRVRHLKNLETESFKEDVTQIFIETPFRNNKMLDAIVKNCRGETKLCLACELTSPHEWIKTQTIKRWHEESIDLHKKQVIFLLKS